MASYENQTNGAGISPKMTLYTNHLCPFAQRAHIALKELDLSYDEVFIDLDKPREQWYLDINPVNNPPSCPASSLPSPAQPPTNTLRTARSRPLPKIHQRPHQR